MNTFEKIKDKLDIVEIASRYTQLERGGRNGRLKGPCPLHNESQPSFFVYPENQRWHCFGCGRGGDVFDLYEATEKLDIKDALRELAREAGVALHPPTPEEQDKDRQRRQREVILGVAVAHWQSVIHRPNSPGMTYAIGRGWDKETVECAGLGYHEEVTRLRNVLIRAGIDLQSPAAQAVIQTPPGSLIYPHFDRGSAVYYAARSVENKRHWNPPADLIGPRQPYYNHHYTRTSNTVIVVEGQGDGVTVAHWGRAAVALAGTSISPDVVERLKKHKTVYIGVEANDAGMAAARKLADELGALVRLVYWPGEQAGADANDYLLAGANTDAFDDLLDQSSTWLDILLNEAQNASPADAQEAIRAVFASLIHVDQFALTKLQGEVCKTLNITSSTFTKLLQVARMDAGMDQYGRPLYEVIGGQICRRVYDRYGGETINPLAKFSAEIVEDVVEDDGLEQTRYFVLDGKLPDSTPLPRARVSASDFGKMNWVLDEWGASAMVMAGRGTSDHLRAAIQTLSINIEKRHEYAHMGWREIGGEMCYLSSNGAIGKPEAAIRLHPDFRRYHLPMDIDGADVTKAVRTSLKFLEVGRYNITIPLWAAMYLAPLSSIFPPAFTLWLFGTTGTLKSSVTALAMCHYGTFSYDLPAPGSWMSSTTYAMRVKAFVAKDTPLWVDDYAKQSTNVGERELCKKAEVLLREWGNRSGRSAGQVDGSLRTTHDPRGLVISTAEQLPPNQSLRPRLYNVEIHPGDVSSGTGSNLTQAQNEDTDQYRIAMHSYLRWLAPQLDTLPQVLDDRKHHLIKEARKSITRHKRSPANAAILAVGWEMGLQHALEIGAIDANECDAWKTLGWNTIVALGEQQDSEVNLDEDPVTLYLTAIRQMLRQGTIYLRHAENPNDSSYDMPLPGQRTNNAEFVGWFDEQYWYLMDQPIYNAVHQFYRAGGRVFPDSKRGVKVKLHEQGLLHPHASRGLRYRLTLGDEDQDVLRVVRSTE